MKILLIGLVWPEPTSSAAGWRILQLIKLFSKLYEVHFASAAQKSEFSYPLNTLGVTEKKIKLNDTSFDEYIQELQPDVVLFDRFMVEEQYGWRVAEHCPKALRILDTEDLHFVRLARQEAYKKKQEVDLYTTTAKREIASILRSDISLIISETEMDLLQQEFAVAANRLFYLPFQEESLTAFHQQSVKSFSERKHFMFIGNFIHEPNFKTVEVLKKEIWPILRKQLPEAELHIYGAYATQKVLQLHNPKERFFIKGRAADARQTIEQYRLLIAPIPFGAGAKGKFVDAMYAGTPSVTTAVGAEAMSKMGRWNGFVEDDLSLFIEKAETLYKDSELWYKAQNEGFSIFNEEYANQSYSQQLLEWIASHVKHVETLRSKNFIGQILLENQLNATKYMSLWIEQKNKSSKT